MKLSQNVIAILILVTLTLVVVFPLFPPGFVLTLDMPATSKLTFPPFSSNNFFLSLIFYLFHFIIPNYVIQKVILITSLMIAGLGMYKLSPTKTFIGKMFAALLYMINPFTYERLVSGQWLLILGYALLPFVVSQTIGYFHNPTFFRLIILAVITTIVANTSLHFLVAVLVFMVIYSCVFVSTTDIDLKKFFSAIIKLLILLILLNINWLISFFVTEKGIGSILTYFDQNDLVSFQSVADPSFGLIFNLLSGFGFWAEANNYFISPKSLFPLWPAVSVVFIAFTIYGFYISVFKRKDYILSITLGIIFLISLDLASGVALKNFAPTVSYLYDKIVFLRAFREPQKLVGLIIFCYAYFGSLVFEKIKKVSICVFILFLPLLYTLPIFWGFWGQLKPVFYPQSWHEVNSILNRDQDNFLVVFFPWHQYMRFRFNNNHVVANPAQYFFDKQILSSSGYETAYLTLRDSRPEGLHIEGLLSIEKQGVNLLDDKINEDIRWGEALSAVGIKYIILSKDADYRDYKFLDTSSELTKIFDSDDIILYQNTSWGKETPIKTENIQDFENL